jgi:pyridoxal phosphate enzyme (YggS family)
VVTDQRRGEIAAGLAAARARIAAAEASGGRAAGSVALVVVTKTFPAEDVAVLHELGVNHVGENRDQEAAPKAALLAGLAGQAGQAGQAGPGLVWHFIGQLQSNKVRSVVRYADVVESVDRPKLAAALGRAAADAGKVVECLIQVGLDDRPGRGGAEPDQVPALADAVAQTEGLRLGGVMAVAPLDGDADVAFARLAQVAALLQMDHPAATTISAGMSGDLEAAVRHGATQVRLGSAVLGYRPPVG